MVNLGVLPMRKLTIGTYVPMHEHITCNRVIMFFLDF